MITLKKVSIVIPVYNAELTIEKCVKSILQQDYKNIEIIVVDDGSTDKTQDIIENYKEKDKRIRYIKQNNSGVSTARNNGMNKAEGEYIVFVDSDDWLKKNMISRMVEIIEKENVDVVRCNYDDIYEKKTVSGPAYEDVNNKKYFHKEYKTSNIYDHFLTDNEPLKNLVMLLCIKRKLLTYNSIYFDKELYMLEDVLFYQKILHFSKSIYFLNENLYNYYENPNSVTHSSEKYEKMIFGILDSNEKINEFLLNNKILSADYIKHINGNHFRIIILYLYYIWKEKGRKELKIILNKLYNNSKFNTLISNYDNYHISRMFNMFFISIVKKQSLKLRILFFLKRIKGGITSD